MTKYYQVIYTDYGDSCDGFARIHGAYKTKEKAKEEMDYDVEFYRRRNHYPMIVRQDSAMVGDEEHGCQWQILEVEM